MKKIIHYIKNPEIIKSPEEMYDYASDKGRLRLYGPDIRMLMEIYSDQNLTEYKRRLKEGIDKLWDTEDDFTTDAHKFIINLIDSIDLNKK